MAASNAIMGESERCFNTAPTQSNDLFRRSSVPDQDSNTRVIPLSRGLFATVDAADYEWLSQWSWKARPNHLTAYAIRTRPANIRPRTIWMHRLILDAPSHLLVDHIDGNGLNNRRSNLRLCTGQQNELNKPARSKHGFKGVFWHERDQLWIARMRIDGKKRHLGSFRNIQDAARAYDEASLKLHGEFSYRRGCAAPAPPEAEQEESNG